MKNISVRVPEWLFLEVEESARKCGISKGAVLRQLALKRFDCETLQGFEAEPRTPSPASLSEPFTTLSATGELVPYGDYIPETMSRETYLLMDAHNREFVIRGEMNWPLKPKTV